MSISMKGLKTQQPLREKHCPTIKQAVTAFDGFRLDYLNINVDLVKYEDFEDLIKLLEIHKYCFWTPSEPARIILNKKP